MSNEKSCALEVFCAFAVKAAAGDENFVLVTFTDENEGLEGLSVIPQDRRIDLKNTDRGALLNAAGLAVGGKKPWVLGTASAIASHGYGIIRDAIALPALPVRLVVYDGGLSKGREGASKLILEDIALMRAMPAMSVFVPSDVSSFNGIAATAMDAAGPVYIRLGALHSESLDTEANAQFTFGGGRILREGTDITICSCGSMVCESLEAAEILAQQGINAEVIDCYSIKPFPQRLLLSSVRRTGCCVTAEEHSSVGGLYGAVINCLAQAYPVPVRSVAVEDRFVHSGTPGELREYCGITWQEIVNAAAQAWALRRR